MGIHLGKLLGNGATADVYEYGNDKVIKLFATGSSIDTVRWEYNKTLSAYESNLPVPKIYDIIEYNNRYGIVMEYVPGETFKCLIDKDIMQVSAGEISSSIFAERILEYVKQTARFLFDIHKIKTDQIEAMDNQMLRGVKGNQFLSDEEKKRVIKIIEDLPKGNSVCHGDPNPNNIIVNGDQFKFIDWVNSGVGNPMYDIAEYVLMFTPSTNRVPENTPPELIEFIDKYANKIVPAFLEEYEYISNLNVSNYKDWFIPLLVSKLNSNRTIDEKNIILDDIRKRLKDY